MKKHGQRKTIKVKAKLNLNLGMGFKKPFSQQKKIEWKNDILGQRIVDIMI